MKEEKYWILLSKKIAGEATAEELELLRHLISGNPEWQTIMENLQELWNSQPITYNSRKQQQSEDAYLTHINRLKEKVSDFEAFEIATEGFTNATTPLKTKKPFYRHWISYAAAAAVVAAVFLLNPFTNSSIKKNDAEAESPVNEITINPGSRSKIQLPDGSQVWINSGSKLTYHNSFNGSTREVQLDGEAYFDVVKDAEHPFIVHTSGIDIKVLGTAFNVKAYKAEPFIEATLIHGSIEVINKNRPGAPKVMLKPHEKLVYNKFPEADSRDQRADAVIPSESDAYSITIKPLNKNIADIDIVETAWVYNKFSFEDERFEDLAHKMERWYNVKISIENEKLKNHRVSGSFVNETAEEAMKELQFLIPFRYSVKNNEIVIIKK
jgi:transmembrane sensor